MSHQICHSAVEARTKWCPFAREAFSNPHNDTVIASANRPIGMTAACECIADDCMAWRWVETHINNPDAPEGDLIPSGNTHGYCGLAGNPT